MIKYDVSIRDFLLTGQLGPIHPGLGQDLVRRIIGAQPDNELKHNYCPYPHLLVFRDLELVFSLPDSSSLSDWKIETIKLVENVTLRHLHQVTSPFYLPDVLKLDPCGVYFEMPLLKFCRTLDFLNISYNFAKSKIGDDIFVLTPGRVDAYFQCGEESDFCKESAPLQALYSNSTTFDRYVDKVPIERLF